MNTWFLLGRIGDYYIWRMTTEDRPVYNVTKTTDEPTGNGGWYTLESLLKVRYYGKPRI